jgi:peroxiredoxin
MTKKLTLIVWVMVAALAVGNALLIRQNLQMRQALARYEPDVLKPGDKVPAFSAAELGGEKLEVNYTGAGPKRVLLFFTPTCPFCRKQFPHWREILKQARQDRLEVIGVVDEKEDKAKLEEYLRTMDCAQGSPTPLRVALVSKDVRARYKLTATPVTVLVGNDGTVEKYWGGAWSEGETSEATSILGLGVPSALSLRVE